MTDAITDEYECAQAWTALSAAHARVTGQLHAGLAASCGLTPNDFDVLLRLHRAGQPGVRLSALNSAVRLTQPSVSRAVARLCQRGLLARQDDPDDGRGILISLTESGREVLARAVALHADTIRALLLDRLTEAEQEVLARALTRVAEE
ncbi:MAG TPA: MarR family transcriptional regulator [Streptosporangiaceae bacterium]|jgi:DNA-binding MarR family transcriptional regulator|nr:MarR family transcriptional regulator [Streptosporangiaceae bacterium]